jgi:DNA invertase Pin-like site-specific DNA recombinase
MLYGYARVSTLDQETTLQLDALARAGAERVFSEKVSAVGRRDELQALLQQLQPGDSLLVYKLDRLARSLDDLLKILARVRGAGASLRSLTEPIDTETLAGRMMLQMLGVVAEFERGLIRERTQAGVDAARARGIRLGRPRAVPEHIERAIVEVMESGAVGYNECAQLFGVKFHVVSNAVWRARKERRQSPSFLVRNDQKHAARPKVF